MSTRNAHALDPHDEIPTTLLHFPTPTPGSPAQVPASQRTPPPTSSTSPSPAPPRPRLASSNPDEAILSPDLGPYSLLEDVRQAQQQHHAAKEKVTLYQFPAYLTTNLRRVLARNRNNRADWAVALSCLLWRGLLRYASLPAATDLSDGLLALDVDDELGTVAGEQVEMWRKGFRYQVPDPTHSMGFERVRSWKAPEHIHAELYERAGKLGLVASSLGMVSIMAALEDQEGVLAEHGRYMREAVAELDRLLEERGCRLRGVCRAIEAGVWR
jgi:hypothetical protein